MYKEIVFYYTLSMINEKFHFCSHTIKILIHSKYYLFYNKLKEDEVIRLFIFRR